MDPKGVPGEPKEAWFFKDLYLRQTQYHRTGRGQSEGQTFYTAHSFSSDHTFSQPVPLKHQDTQEDLHHDPMEIKMPTFT